MNKLMKKVFFYGDYPAHKTASGKEESGIRLAHNLLKKKARNCLIYVSKGL